MKNNLKHIVFLSVLALVMMACHNDLDQYPIDPDSFTEEDVYANAAEAKGALAKLYAGYVLTGQQGPSDQPDIADIDEGASQFTRMLYNLNELTTDHAVVGWGDPGLPDLHGLYWSGSNSFSEAMYYRLAQEVSFCNSFIENASTLTDDAVTQYIAEARFLRAFAYYNLIDLYANVPLVTQVSTELPTQNTRAELFEFVETELLEIQDLLAESGANEYGRVDQVAAWALLSKLYLNAEVWTGEDRYSDCITYSNLAINSSYAINTTDANGNGTAYDELFLADNDTNGAQNEFIVTANFDGLKSKTYGGTTFLVHAAIGGDVMVASNYGVNGGWGGMRTTKALVEKFNSNDQRAMFFTDGQNLEIEDLGTFTDGYAVVKFTNIDSNGAAGNDPDGEFVSTDLALIRLAEIYLNYAEATLRGGDGGSTTTALGLINELRERAYGNTSGNIAASGLTLDFILDERSRELYWEGQRRTDLVRYNYFTTATYLWPFKGNSADGTSVSAYRNIFPIPASILTVNTNLTQNEGY
ncbi:MAG: RagB/SusD family nutrient uptake outer membrane protein [Flavobacteriaceae bacterium]